MGRYLARRLLLIALLIFLVGNILYFCLRYFPGSPFSDEDIFNPLIRSALEQKFGVHKNFFDGLCLYWQNILQGDFGYSILSTDKTVTQLLLDAMPVSLELAAISFIVILFFGLFLGVLPAFLDSLLVQTQIAQNLSRGTRLLSQFFLSMPTLFLGPLLLWVFCFEYEIFPMRYNGDSRSLILPVFLLSFRNIFLLSQVLDSSLKQTLAKPFVQTFYSIGTSRSRFVWRWALKNSLPAYFGQIPSVAAGVFSGSLLIEVLFSMHGLGFLMFQGLQSRDWMLITAIVFFSAVVLISVQLIVDIILINIDPRIRLQ